MLWLEQIKINDHGISETLKWLAYGPRSHAMSYSCYIINGLRFHTKDSEKSTQNSGVSIEAETICRSSVKDTNQIVGKISYYGIIKDIILLDCHSFRVPLFKCHWANIPNGVRIDEDGFTLVNLYEGQSQFEKDPFILASQAKQVFYSRENDTSSWYIVLKAPPRCCFNIEICHKSDYTAYSTLDRAVLKLPYDSNEYEHYARKDCDDIIIG